MTNVELITIAMLNAELDPEEVEVDTFAGWKRRGFSVRKGQKSVFSTKIWKPKKYTDKEIEEIEAKTGKPFDANSRKLILVNANFFTDAQVERRVSK